MLYMCVHLRFIASPTTLHFSVSPHPHLTIYLSACTSRDDKRNLNLTTCAAALVDAALAQYSREKEGLDADQANVRARERIASSTVG